MSEVPAGTADGALGRFFAMTQAIVDPGDPLNYARYGTLEALPGVGHKTASVVMAQAFDVPAFPVDTHIHRLAWRWGLSEGKNVEQTERDLMALFPKASWNKLHLQIIFFGRQYCPARTHKPDQCPVCSWAFSQKRRKEEFR